jgi:hypothetical protein
MNRFVYCIYSVKVMSKGTAILYNIILTVCILKSYCTIFQTNCGQLGVPASWVAAILYMKWKN